MGKSGGQVKIFEERWTKQMQEKAEKRVEMLKKRVKRCVCKSCGGKLSLRQLYYNEFEDARIEIATVLNLGLSQRFIQVLNIM